MQGSGLEKEPWAHLPLPGLLSLLSDARRTDVSEAPMQDLQGVDEGSRVAVSHQKYDILNGSRFPHTCCGTLMFMCRRRGRSSKEGRLGSRVISEAEGTKGLWELAGFTSCRLGLCCWLRSCFHSSPLVGEPPRKRSAPALIPLEP